MTAKSTGMDGRLRRAPGRTRAAPAAATAGTGAAADPGAAVDAPTMPTQRTARARATPTAPSGKAPSGKAPSSKAPSGKAPSSKAPSGKVTAAEPAAGKPVRKVTASKATATKATTAKPATKVTATKATPTKAPATKATATKATATPTKATPTKATATEATATEATATKATPAEASTPAASSPQAAEAVVAPPVKAAPDTLPATVAGAAALWTAAELAEVGAELADRAQTLRTEIYQAESASVTAQRDASGEGSGDEADAGTKTFEREYAMSLAHNRADQLIQVERALYRLQAGSYGACEHCGSPIPKARLQAFPKITLCVGCKTREERR